jgi:hypothetical protein
MCIRKKEQDRQRWAWLPHNSADPGTISAQSGVNCNLCRSWCHGLNVKISRRLSHGFTFQGDYMFSKHLESNRDHCRFMGDRCQSVRSVRRRPQSRWIKLIGPAKSLNISCSRI